MSNITIENQQREITMWGRRYLLEYFQNFIVFMHSSQFIAKQLRVIFPVQRAPQFQSLEPRNALLDAMRSSICPQNKLLLVVNGGLTLKLIEKLFFLNPECAVRSNSLSMRVISRRHKLPEVTCVNTQKGHSGQVFSVAFHPSLPFMVTGSCDNTAILSLLSPDGLSATRVETLKGHWGNISCVAFHPTAPLLATGSFDRTIRLWKIGPDGSPATCVATLLIHDSVLSVAFHPTAPLLATGSADNTAKLWRLSADNSSATCVATLKGHSDEVRSVAFHPTAPLLATGSSSGRVKVCC